MSKYASGKWYKVKKEVFMQYGNGPDVSNKILDCIRYDQRPTLAGTGITRGHAYEALKILASHLGDLATKPQILSIARAFEIEDFPELNRTQWIYVAAALKYYEGYRKRAEETARKKDEKERNVLLSEIGFEEDSQTKFNLE
jgi:hypothetical protein